MTARKAKPFKPNRRELRIITFMYLYETRELLSGQETIGDPVRRLKFIRQRLAQIDRELEGEVALMREEFDSGRVSFRPGLLSGSRPNKAEE